MELAASELYSAFHWLSIRMKPAEVLEVVRGVDKDGDGMVSLQDWLEWVGGDDETAGLGPEGGEAAGGEAGGGEARLTEVEVDGLTIEQAGARLGRLHACSCDRLCQCLCVRRFPPRPLLVEICTPGAARGDLHPGRCWWSTHHSTHRSERLETRRERQLLP